MSQPYQKHRGGSGRGGNNNNKFKTPCKYFLRGSCSNNRCPYLHVRPGNSKSQDGAGQTQGTTSVLSTMLKLFFEKQQTSIFNAEMGMLDLSGLLSRYDDLKAVSTSVNLNTRTFCVALCMCVRDLIVPAPSILRLDDNNITSLHHMATAMVEADLHIPLKAISIANNQIKSTDVAQELKEFTNLVEVNLIGNPVTEQADYKQRFKKFLPFLMGLDGQSLTAMPLVLPWPRFYGESPQEAGPSYDATQQNVLQFVQTQIIHPLEADASSGQPAGVDAVSDSYAVNSMLTLCLSSTDAAVTTPQKTVGGTNVSTQRNVVREIVGLRLRQTEGNHNVVLGVKSSQVATGRTKVCAQLEHWLYPKNFSVTHYIHGSPGVVVLENTGCGPNGAAWMNSLMTVVTLHGVMIWRHRPAGSASDPNASNANLRDAVVIKRNFARVLTVSSYDPGRWQVVNDMVTLFPFTGTVEEGSTALSSENYLMRDIHPYDVLFMPASDPNRAARLGRRFRVPTSVVASLSKYVQHDLELFTILADIGGIPMETFEACAAMVDMDPLASIYLCRMGNRLGVEPAVGVGLLKQHGFNWIQIEQAAATAQQPP